MIPTRCVEMYPVFGSATFCRCCIQYNHPWHVPAVEYYVGARNVWCSVAISLMIPARLAERYPGYERWNVFLTCQVGKWFTAFSCKLKESVLRVIGTGSGWIIGLAHGVTKKLTAQLSSSSKAKSKKWYWKPRPKQIVNKIDTGSISFYIVQILGLAATSEICEIPVCGLTTDMKMKHIYFHISSRKTLEPFALHNLGFIVFSSHLVLSFLHSFFV